MVLYNVSWSFSRQKVGKFVRVFIKQRSLAHIKFVWMYLYFPWKMCDVSHRGRLINENVFDYEKFPDATLISEIFLDRGLYFAQGCMKKVANCSGNESYLWMVSRPDIDISL